MSIQQIKTYLITCDGEVQVDEDGLSYRESCTSSVEVRATSKYEALRNVPEGWDELFRHTGEHVRCPRDHLW